MSPVALPPQPTCFAPRPDASCYWIVRGSPQQLQLIQDKLAGNAGLEVIVEDNPKRARQIIVLTDAYTPWREVGGFLTNAARLHLKLIGPLHRVASEKQ